MAKLVWDQTSEKIYETGADHAVLYLPDSSGAYVNGYAWNGLLGVDENPSGAEPTKLWADNINYATMYSAEEYGLTIRAYTYPDEFEQCDGSAEISEGVFMGQQGRRPFGFSYRTLIGNDVAGTEYGYKLHLVYGCMASPSAKTHDTVNDSPAAVEMSWDVTTTPVADTTVGSTKKPTSTIVVDSTKVSSENLTALEALLYGGENADPVLPSPADVIALFSGSGNTTPVVPNDGD